MEELCATLVKYGYPEIVEKSKEVKGANMKYKAAIFDMDGTVLMTW